jgi:ubiquinone/menaquinone biosynthesis C-methylase UbiE
MPNDNIADANLEQAEYWNDQAGPKWVQAEAVLDAQLKPLGERAIDAVPVKPGMRVLDVGCGCGDTTLEVARRVGPDGEAVGVDLSAPMLERAAERAREQSLLNARFVRGDATTFRPDDEKTFDAAVSRFGVMFFADSVASFTNIRALLTPNSRLSFICWQAVDKNPWIYVPTLAAAEHIEIPRPADPYAPGPFAFADADRTRTILSDAGFSDIAFESLELELAVGGGGSPEQAAEFLMNLGPVARILKDKPETDRRIVVDAIRNAIVPYDKGDGVRMGSAAWLVTANAG